MAREYNISLCADKEKEGRTYCILNLCSYVISFLSQIFAGNKELVLFLTIPMFGIVVAEYIYMFKIYLGLCKIFNRNKRWLWAFGFFEGITLFIWGVSKNFVPSKQYEDHRKKEGAKALGQDIKAIDNGLTVNITDRTVIDFFKKRTLLKDIHMTIPKGHMVLLLGGSGAGKTTL